MVSTAMIWAAADSEMMMAPRGLAATPLGSPSWASMARPPLPEVTCPFPATVYPSPAVIVWP